VSAEAGLGVAAAPAPAGRPAELAPRQRLGLLRRTRLSSRVAAVILVLVVLMAVVAPVLPLQPPNAINVAAHLLGFGQRGHLLGTDQFGRDLLSRVVWGARTSLLAGIVPVLAGGVIGTVLGVIAGLGNGAVNGTIMRALDVLFAFPALLLAIVIAATFRAGLSTEIIAITVIVIPPLTRIAEEETRRVRGKDYVLVARSAGARWHMLTLSQVLPNVAPAILVYATSLVGLSIVYSAGLSFLGLGVAAPTADWGAMVNDMKSLIFSQPLLSLVPAVPIFGVSVAFTVLGDGLRDALAVESARL
jgi:peptide/nickel transport system permease protein